MVRAYVVKFVLGVIFVGGAMTLTASDDNERPKETSEVPAGCRLSVTTEHKSYSAGQPIVLTVVLENQSKEAVDLNRGRGAGFMYKVSLPNGKLAPLTLEGQQRLGNADSGSRSRVTIEPGKSYTAKISNLNRLYDMTLAGKYEIKVSRHIRPPNKDVEIESNTVEIVITNAIAKPPTIAPHPSTTSQPASH